MANHANKSTCASKKATGLPLRSQTTCTRSCARTGHRDSRVERLVPDTFVPASEAPWALAAGVAIRDVVMDPATGMSARLFLSTGAVSAGRRLPLVVYFHGGAFCTGSAFSKVFHRYAASMSARAGALVVSVDYRLAPEHPWVALRWTASRSDPWLACHADPRSMFLAGESAGANIAHGMVARLVTDGGGGIDIGGIVLLHPFFWGPERLLSETDRAHDGSLFSPKSVDTLWAFLTAGAAGNEEPRINPAADQVASLPCRRALVAVATKDLLRDRGRRYAAWLRHGESCRKVTLLESKGREDGFHLYRRSAPAPWRSWTVSPRSSNVWQRRRPPTPKRSNCARGRARTQTGRAALGNGPSRQARVDANEGSKL
ncbi:hypothetical protein BS78_02G296300 [Paspalum vaginatum]|nr:hypothetical protein BS78_02G296300 [Paspalum vaginatum]